MTTTRETHPQEEDLTVTGYSGTPRERRRRWLVALLLVVVAAAIAGYYLWPKPESQTGAQQRRTKGGPSAGRPMPVVAAAAKTADVDVYLSGLGTVTPIATVTVKSRVDGQLVRVLFREGQMVRAGELLAEIDPRPFEVQLTQAEGQLARDQAQLHNAQIDLERYRTLIAQDSVAKQQLDTQAALVRQLEGTVKSDQGQVDNARLQLTYSRVTAPVTGRVGLRQVDPGNIVHASDQSGIVVITQLQPITVVFTLPEDNVHLVMRRMRAEGRLPVVAFDRAEKEKLASGVLLTVDNQIDPTTGTVKLKAQFPNDDYGLFPNQFVNARMLIDVNKGATVIPSAAVQRGTPGTFVYVVNPDKTVTVRPIRLGPAQGENVAVESGVKPGELVVTDGADKLREGAKVELPGGPGAPAAQGKGKGKGKGEGRRPGQGNGAPPPTR